MKALPQASILAFNCFHINCRTQFLLPEGPAMRPRKARLGNASNLRSPHFCSSGDADCNSPSASYEPPPWEVPIHGKPGEIVAELAAVVPRITTGRLCLRTPKLDDFQAYVDIVLSDRWHDPGMTDREDIWLDFLQMVAGWMLRGVGLLAVDHRIENTQSTDAMPAKDSGLVGFVLLNHEYSDKHLEIGWMLVHEKEGKGYATEAARALLDYAHHTLELAGNVPIVSYIAPTNKASIRVAERLGGRRASEMENGCYVYFYDPNGGKRQENGANK